MLTALARNLNGDSELCLDPLAEEERLNDMTLPLGRFIFSVAKWHLNSVDESPLPSSYLCLLVGV
jgi:hypothetical protein